METNIDSFGLRFSLNQIEIDVLYNEVFRLIDLIYDRENRGLHFSLHYYSDLANDDDEYNDIEFDINYKIIIYLNNKEFIFNNFRCRFSSLNSSHFFKTLRSIDLPEDDDNIRVFNDLINEFRLNIYDQLIIENNKIPIGIKFIKEE